MVHRLVHYSDGLILLYTHREWNQGDHCMMDPHILWKKIIKQTDHSGQSNILHDFYSNNFPWGPTYEVVPLPMNSQALL